MSPSRKNDPLLGLLPGSASCRCRARDTRGFKPVTGPPPAALTALQTWAVTPPPEVAQGPRDRPTPPPPAWQHHDQRCLGLFSPQDHFRFPLTRPLDAPLPGGAPLPGTGADPKQTGSNCGTEAEKDDCL